jgi:TolB protein
LAPAPARAALADETAATVHATLRPGPPAGLSGALAFHANREGRRRIFTLDLASGAVRSLTGAADYHSEYPLWSPDGARFAFTTTRFNSQSYDLAVAEAAGDGVRRVTTHPAFDLHPAWAADARSVLFTGEQDGRQAIFRTWLDTGRVERLSPPPNRALMPSASPDGRAIAYTMGTPGGLRVVVQELDTGEVRPVSPEGTDAAEPRWSPDGRRLAYTRFTPEGSCIEVLALDTGATSRLAVDGFRDLREAAWSPDGQWLAVAASPVSGPDADWDLVLLQPGTSHAFHLTRGPAGDRAPSWQPG